MGGRKYKKSMISEETFNTSITNVDPLIISYVMGVIADLGLNSMETKIIHCNVDGGVCKPLFNDDGEPVSKFIIELDSKIIKNTHFTKYLLFHELSHAYQILDVGHMKHDESFYYYFKKITPKEFWPYEKQFNKEFSLV